MTIFIFLINWQNSARFENLCLVGFPQLWQVPSIAILISVKFCILSLVAPARVKYIFTFGCLSGIVGSKKCIGKMRCHDTYLNLEPLSKSELNKPKRHLLDFEINLENYNYFLNLPVGACDVKSRRWGTI